MLFPDDVMRIAVRSTDSAVAATHQILATLHGTIGHLSDSEGNQIEFFYSLVIVYSAQLLPLTVIVSSFHVDWDIGKFYGWVERTITRLLLNYVYNVEHSIDVEWFIVCFVY